MIELPNLNIELTEVANLPFDKLKHMYVYLFNRTVNSSRREFFIWRITYRLQELRFGGLYAKTKAILENLDKKPVKEENSLPVGTEITKKYKGKTYRVRIVAGGFELEDEFYKSLSAVHLIQLHKILIPLTVWED